jgi:hypothetical protein
MLARSEKKILFLILGVCKNFKRNRYNAERLSNGLGRVQEQTLDHGSVIVEGYNSHLADVNSGKFWTPRPSFTPVNVNSNITFIYWNYRRICKSKV